MIRLIQRRQSTFIYRVFSALIAFTFVFSSIVAPQRAYAQVPLYSLPAAGSMIHLSPVFTPTIVRGLTIYPDNPLQFDFIVDTGDEALTDKNFQIETKKLIKYFLASLTVPENEMWVNLSPYEKDRIIPEGLGTTEMGKDLLAQDYLLKQLTASLIYPENDLGSAFWTRVRQKIKEQFGTTEIPINTFNKVWIVPDKAVVYEHDGSVFVVERHLKVMLEEDYVALQHNINNATPLSEAKGVFTKRDLGIDPFTQKDIEVLSGISSDVVREVLIPEIEKEVNEGENFANLRQIYNSMILATWYKKNLRESLLGQVYMDKNKVKGVDVKDKESKLKIYNQYLEAFKKGVYDYIREDYDPSTQQLIPRKYFSGGAVGVDSALLVELKGQPYEQLPHVQRAVSSPVGEHRSVTWQAIENTGEEQIASALGNASEPNRRQTSPKDSSAPTERNERSYDGLPNDEYTDGIRTALIQGNFTSFQLNTDGWFIQSGFVLNRDIENQAGQERKSGIIEIDQQNLQLTQDEIETLNDIINRMDVKSKLKDTVIVFIPSQKAHYSVGRNQIYLDVDLLKNPRELRKRLAHEITERTDAIESLSPSLKSELNRTTAYPELRSAELKESIKRGARESHARIKLWEPFSEALNDVEFAKKQFAPQMDETEANELMGLTKSTEKVAMNIIGFYGLETGVATVARLRGQTILEVLDSIEKGSVKDEDLDLIANFAHSTWMTANSSRGLNRAERFVVAPFFILDAGEQNKVYAQIRGGAVLLNKRLRESIDEDADQQDQLMAMWFLLRNEKFSLEIGEYLNNIYNFVTYYWQASGVDDAGESNQLLPITKFEEGVVKRIVPLYALVSALDAIHSRWGDDPQQLLQKIVSGKIFFKTKEGEYVHKDKVYMLARFANATWKAQQPFRGVLETGDNSRFFARLKRPVFKPFDLLSADEIDKDFKHIQKVAEKLTDYLKEKSAGDSAILETINARPSRFAPPEPTDVEPVSGETAREVTDVEPAHREGGLTLLIDVSDDLSMLRYYEVKNDREVHQDGSVDYEKLDLDKIAEIPSSYLVSPTKFIEHTDTLTNDQKDRIARLWNKGKRYTRYRGVITSWDVEVDKDVWAFNIDTGFYIDRLTEFVLPLLEQSTIKTILGVGVGSGHIEAMLAARIPELEQLIGTDISYYALRNFKQSVLANLDPQARSRLQIRTFQGKGIKTINTSVDLAIVNPPYIPSPPWESRDDNDPYRGTGLIREVMESGIDKLNPDNPEASIVINVSSLAQKDFDRYKEEFGDRMKVERIGDALKVPLKVRWMDQRWYDWLVEEHGLEYHPNAGESEYPYWHSLQVYRIRLKAAASSPLTEPINNFDDEISRVIPITDSISFEIGQWDDGEIKLRNLNPQATAGANIDLFHSLQNERSVVQALMIMDNLRHHGANSINLIVPEWKTILAGDKYLLSVLSQFADKISTRQTKLDDLRRFAGYAEKVDITDEIDKIPELKKKELPIKIDRVYYINGQFAEDAHDTANKLSKGAKAQLIAVESDAPGKYQVTFGRDEDPKGKNVVLFHSTRSSKQIVELLLTVRALRAKGVESISLVNTYQSYARQDRIDQTKEEKIGEHLAAATLLKAIDDLVDHNFSFNVHYGSIDGLVGIPDAPEFQVHNLNGSVVLAEHMAHTIIEQELGIKLAGLDLPLEKTLPLGQRVKEIFKQNPIVIVSPDFGGQGYAKHAAEELERLLKIAFGVDIKVYAGFIPKWRDKATNQTKRQAHPQLLKITDQTTRMNVDEVTQEDVENLEELKFEGKASVKDAWAFILDDITDTGGTLRSANHVLIEDIDVSPQRIFNGVVHGTLSNGLKPFEPSAIEDGERPPAKLFVMETLSIPEQTEEASNYYRRVPIRQLGRYAIERIIGKDLDAPKRGDQPQRVGIIGGTFNPFQNAHKKMGEAVFEDLDLNEVIFVPNNVSPFKKGQNPVPGRVRYQWIESSTKDNPNFRVSDFEIERKGPSFTIETVEHLRKQYPEGTEFYFVLGEDNVEGLPSWNRIDELKDLVNFVVFGRPGIERKPSDVPIEAYIERPELDISASKIRERVAVGRPVKGMVSEDIAEELEDYYDPESVFEADVKPGVIRSGNAKYLDKEGRKIPYDKPFIVSLDVHGTLLKSTWKREYALAYDQLTGRSMEEGLEWVEHRIMSEVILTTRDVPHDKIVGHLRQDVMRITDHTVSIDEVEKAINDAREQFKTVIPAQAEPGAIDFVRRLHAMGMPLQFLSGSDTEVILKQLREAGYGEFLKKAEVLGVDDQIRLAREDSKYNRREQAIHRFQNRHPGHRLIHVNDWTSAMSFTNKLGAVNIGVPQGQNKEYRRNYIKLTNEGVDFIISKERDWKRVGDIIRILEEKRLKRVESKVKKKIRVAMAQINPTVGDLLGNYQMHVEKIDEARSLGVDNLSFPELSMTGYPPKDLLKQKAFVLHNKALVEKLAEHTKGITVQVGFVDVDQKGFIYNALVVISDGQIKSVYRKNALANYGVFNEKRYFRPGKRAQLYDFDGNPLKEKILDLDGVRECTGICEDGWVSQKAEQERPRVKKIDVLPDPDDSNLPEVYLEYAALGANVHYYSNASPYREDVLDLRLDLFTKRAKETGAWVVYTNLFGGQDELVFDGASFIINPQGEVVVMGKRFEEDLIVTDIEVETTEMDNETQSEKISLFRSKKEKPVIEQEEIQPSLDRLDKIEAALIVGMREYFRKNGMTTAIVGLSGGIDSAYTTYLATKALGKDNVIAISMPTKYNVDQTKSDARSQAQLLGIRFFEHAIEAYRQLAIEDLSGFPLEELTGNPSDAGKTLFNATNLVEENIQPKDRTKILYAISNAVPGSLVLATGNKSELSVGYFTYGGDDRGGWAAIQDIYKTDVYALSKRANKRAGRKVVLKNTIEIDPSAELGEGQKDSDSLPPYPVLDAILKHLIDQNHSISRIVEDGFDLDLVKRIDRMVKTSQWKRDQAPKGANIGRVSFKANRSMPNTNKYDEISVEEFLAASSPLSASSSRVRIRMGQLEKAYKAFEAGKTQRQAFDLIAPEAPHGGSIIVNSGLEVALGNINDRRFSVEYIEKLRKTGRFSEEFLNYLLDFTFGGDIDALQEGRIVTPGIPLMRIYASEVELALVEDIIKNRIGVSTVVATKTLRIVQAASGEFVSQDDLDWLKDQYGLDERDVKKLRGIMEFGYRRAQGQGAHMATRASVMGGAIGTSNVQASWWHYLTAMGTMAHLFIMAFGPDRELDAFRAYVKHFPAWSTLLIDTYDTIEGAKKAAIVAKEMEARGEQLVGVRLDSGDMVSLSRQVRKIFDDAGLHHVKIFSSDSLDEDKINELISQGAMIDGFGVGTNLITGGKQASLDLEFIKSKEERIWRSQTGGSIIRHIQTPKGRMVSAEYSEDIEEILMPYWRNGKRVFGVEKPWKSRERALSDLARIKPENKRLYDAEDIPLEFQDNPLSINPDTDVLLVVDEQPTFMPGGGLAVADGDQTVNPIQRLMRLFPKRSRYASKDYHPKGHNSLIGSYVGLDPYTILATPQVATALTNDGVPNVIDINTWTEKDNPIAPYWDGKGEELQGAYARFTLEELREDLSEARGNMQVLWPDHAVQGTEEAELHPALLHHTIRESNFAYVQIKGTDPNTDSYSALNDNRGNPTGLAQKLKDKGFKRIFAVGLACDYCVGFTALDARDEDFEVFVVKDSTRSVDLPPGNEKRMFESFDQRGVQVVDLAEMIVAANNSMGVVPAAQLAEPIAHPIALDSERNIAFEEDMYHLTMIQALFNEGMHEIPATFDYFYRTAPYEGNFIITSGLSKFLDDLRDFQFSDADIEYLRGLNAFSDELLDYLKNFKFSGDIVALPDGSVAYPHEPIKTVKGTALETLIIETFILNRRNFPGLIATNANRLAQDSDSGSLIEDGLDVAQGDADLEAAIAAYIGGVDYTTNLDAHLQFDIPLADSETTGMRLRAELVTGGIRTALNGVFKLARFNGIDKIKLSEILAKISLPGDKEIWAIIDSEGNFLRRVTSVEGEEVNLSLGEKVVYPRIKVVDQGDIKSVGDIHQARALRDEQVIAYAHIREAELSEGLKAKRLKLIDEARSVDIEHRYHTVARMAQPEGYPQRFPVSARQVPWNVDYPKYDPPKYTAPSVLANDYTLDTGEGWADPEDIKQVWADIKAGRRPRMVSHEGLIKLDPETGWPMNPNGRTGLTGRGLLGGFGPNLAADAAVTRKNPDTDVIELLVGDRTTSGKTAFPGGMKNKTRVDGKVQLVNTILTALRELGEETKVVLDLEDVESHSILYRGYVDDDRNTDISWMETELVHIHVSDPKRAAKLIPEDTEEMENVRWVPITEVDTGLFYASHSELFELVKGQFSEAELSSSPVKTEPVGGINLNSAMLDLQIKRDGNGIPLPVSQQPIYDMRIEGFLPVIINVAPISVPLLLGLSDDSEDQEANEISYNSTLDPLEHRNYLISREPQQISFLN